MGKTKHKLNEILVKHTGQDLATIEKDTDRDNFMSADEAVAYGLIDKAVDSMPRDGKKAARTDSKGRKVTARYLPDKAWKSMSKAQAKATDAKKRAASKKGKGVVPNTRKAKKAGKRACK